MTKDAPVPEDILVDLPEIIQVYIASYNRRDLSGLMACLHDDIHFSNFSNGVLDAEARGKAAFSEMAQSAIEAFATRHQTVTSAITVGPYTSLEIEYRATVAQDLPNGWRAGSDIALMGRSLFQVSQGQIIRLIDES